MPTRLSHFLLLLLLFSCTNQSNQGADAVYADYAITAEEGSENVTCLFRFYNGSPNGATLVLEPPATVLLDDQPVPVDSAGLSGAFYEVQRPMVSFAGQHTILFKNADGKAFIEKFSFQPFSLTTEIDAAVPWGAITVQLSGLRQTENLRVLLIDTSFTTPDINDVQTVHNGRLVISPQALQNVTSGPVTLNLIKEEERPLQNGPGRGGKLSVTYSLSRQFELTE